MIPAAKQKKLCDQLGCSPYDPEIQYDIIINATSVGMATMHQTTFDFPLPKGAKDHIALDNVYHPPWTPFLTFIKDRGGHIITGKEMFIYMALGQFKIMFGSCLNSAMFIKKIILTDLKIFGIRNYFKMIN